jgi:hypothetical protein
MLLKLTMQAVMILAKKVASKTGDVRRGLELARKAVLAASVLYCSCSSSAGCDGGGRKGSKPGAPTCLKLANAPHML